MNEFTQAVHSLAGEADLEIGGPRAGFDEREYARVARLAEVAVASPVVEVEAKVIGRREPCACSGWTHSARRWCSRTSSQATPPTGSTGCGRMRCFSAPRPLNG